MKVRRLIIGLDPVPRRWALIEEAVAAAGRMEAELIALFVENAALLDFAQLPFAREVGAVSAARRALDAQAMERSLRAMAGEARRMLEAAAGRSSVRWSFRVARGSLVEVLLAEAGEEDLVIATAGHPAEHGRAWKARVVHLDDPEQALAALEAAGGEALVLASEDVARLREALRRLARGQQRDPD
ncbi:MAG TPA: hypothetical protein VNK67_10650 [Burkholderiales bacterium]|nr:hypothetical protein [Burkholderiales bacterium]